MNNNLQLIGTDFSTNSLVRARMSELSLQAMFISTDYRLEIFANKEDVADIVIFMKSYNLRIPVE